MTDEEFEAFREAADEMEERMLADLAADTGQTVEEIKASVAEYEMPDPEDLRTTPAEECSGGE